MVAFHGAMHSCQIAQGCMCICNESECIVALIEYGVGVVVDLWCMGVDG